MTAPLLLFAHGAGLGSSSPWMRRWADYLAPLGMVHTFDYPYMRAGKKRPDRPAVLLEAHREALEEALERHGSRPVVLIGKSMGSRMGCHLATEPDLAEVVHAIVCLGYPLVGLGRTRKVRDEVLLALRHPILFVQGTRDRLCPLDLLEEVRPRMSAPNEIFVVEGGDHSLRVRKRDLAQRGIDQEASDEEAVRAIAAFTSQHAGSSRP